MTIYNYAKTLSIFLFVPYPPHKIPRLWHSSIELRIAKIEARIFLLKSLKHHLLLNALFGYRIDFNPMPSLEHLSPRFALVSLDQYNV